MTSAHNMLQPEGRHHSAVLGRDTNHGQVAERPMGTWDVFDNGSLGEGRLAPSLSKGSEVL